jgi:hypothetical protein
MADKKISALTGVTTPLAGTEVVPLVQGGVTKNVSVANLTAGRAVSTGALSVVAANATLDNAFSLSGKLAAGSPVSMMRRNSSDQVAIDEDGYGAVIGFGGRYNFAGGGDFTVGVGNVVIGTSGKGIDFSATPGTGTSELLSDYEEGTWTPTYYGAAGSDGSLAYAEQTGKYTKIGRQVTVTGTIILTDKGSWTGRVQIGGLPFNSTIDQYSGQVELRDCTFTGNYVVMEIGRAATTFARFVIVSGLGANTQIEDTNVANNSGFLFTLTYMV